MLGDPSSTVLPTQTTTNTPTSIDPPPPQATILAHEGIGGEVGEGGGPQEDELSRGRDIVEGGGERSSGVLGGNRWPRQETLALLKIRSDMDVAFKEASVKGPLWEEVSRKLAELGYNRSAKKCREKFENVFKYHKRTKEGRTGKSDGKTYRFFDQLEAFESEPALSLPPPPPLRQPAPPRSQAPAITAAAMPVANNPPGTGIGAPSVTVPSTTLTPPTINFSMPPYPQGNNPTMLAPAPPPQQPTNVSNPPQINVPSSNFLAFSSDLMSDSSSSSTSSDVEIQGRHRRKRKWKELLERLMREVIQKQEDMQRRFLEAIEKREHERMVREESWRVQEMARINREREILAQEKSIAAAKDAALMAFLQKLSDQQNMGQVQLLTPPMSQPPPPVPLPPQTAPLPTPTPAPQPLLQQQQPVPAAALAAPMQEQQAVKRDNGDQNFMPASSSRWPKVEVQALIRLRTSLDSKYLETGPKGPLWEEISSQMRKLGYNRSSKRCKEKWENINKYFKKVKESNKKRPDDSKTCPYFHQLEALYKEKNKMFDGSSSSTNLQFRPKNSVPLMVQPEQQWPPPPTGQHEHNRGHDSVMEDLESEQDPQDEDDKDNEDEEEDEAGEYEIVANSGNKAASMTTVE